MAQYRGFPWRFLFADLASNTTTWADGLLTNRRMSFALNQSATIEAAVWPDDARVNTIYQGDGYPLVAQSNRIVYGFRREDPAGLSPWVCRAAGILMSPEDQADTDVPLSHFVAYDPWEYLNARQCVSLAGDLPGPNGFTNTFLGAATGDQLVLNMLLNTIANEPAATDYGSVGNGTFIDAGVAWGGTAFYGTLPGVPSVLETTSIIAFTIQQGTTVGDLWTQLTGSADLDIVLRPIYDMRRPGYTHELSIYKLAGADRANAIFGWDLMNRGMKRVDRMHDGTPGSFENKILYYVGQGGQIHAPLVTNAPSIAAYGTYWSQQFFPNMPDIDPTGGAVYKLAVQARNLFKQGRRTVTIDPIPERSPIPLLDYELGDRVKLYASKNLRTTIAGYERVEAIPIEVLDDGIESVSALLVSPDWRGSTPAPPPPPTAPRITYAYDGASTLVVSIPTAAADTSILVGLASDDDLFLVTDDGTTQDAGSWADAIVTSDPVGAYGPTLILTNTGIAYESDGTFGSTADYFVTPRNATVFRAALLVMAGTDAAPGQTPPDLTTFGRLGPVVTFTYGVASTVTSPPFTVLPVPLPLPTGGGGTPTGGIWSWDATAATVDPSSAAKIATWLSTGGTFAYFTAAVAHATAAGGTLFYDVPTSEVVSPVSCPIPIGTHSGASADKSLYVRSADGLTDYDLSLANYNATSGRITSCFGATVTPVGSAYETGPCSGSCNNANAACFPLAEGPITTADVVSGVINHPLVFTSDGLGPAPNPYPARPGTSGYPGGPGFPLGTWLRLPTSVNVAGLGLPAFETMICYALQSFGMFCRDIGTTVDIIGIDMVNQGGNVAAWAAVGVTLTIPGVSGYNYAVALDAGMPWSSLEVLLPPP